MSFDQTFDYTPVVTGLGNEKTAIQAELTKITEERDMLNAAAQYAADVEVINRKIQLDVDIERHTAHIGAIDAVLAEIAEVQGLAANKKDDLMYFYTTVGVSKQDFMARMLFNHDRALNDEKIARLRADVSTPAASRVAIAKLYYANYVISHDVTNVVMSIFRYVR